MVGAAIRLPHSNAPMSYYLNCFLGIDRPGTRTLIAHLRVRSEESAGLLNYLAACQKNGISFIDEYGMLVFAYIQTRLEAELNWIETAITQLEGPRAYCAGP